jgi:hypothetical protein
MNIPQFLENARGIHMKTSSSDGRTEPINGMQMYYELRGEGEPLVLLHGGTGIGADWALIFNDPPKDYRLVVSDLFAETALAFLRGDWQGA